MKIGIDGSRAFIPEKTGIEEYSYQVIKNLRRFLTDDSVVIYLRKNQKVDFKLPPNWKVKNLSIPRFWTQLGLSWEVLRKKMDILFVPAHVLPIIHPKNSVVVIHGLEFEVLPEAYSWWGRFYMHLSVHRSCRWAKKIVAVSQNTKKDLERLYGVSSSKIEVVPEGANENILTFASEKKPKRKKKGKGYLLFVGRLEKRKNVLGILEAFEVLKEKYGISQELFLVGKPGYGYGDIEKKIYHSKFKKNIHTPGFVDNWRKWELMANCDLFLFPSFYEGFGLPVLEAQILGAPVLTSNVASLPEVAGKGAALADPQEPVVMADSIFKILQDPEMKKDLVDKGKKNTERFSWKKCAKEVAEVLMQSSK